MKRKKTQNLGVKQRLKNSSPVEREDLISGLPYSIGYAKPPPSGQFKPGQSGNRRGRSKGCGDLGKLLEDELNVTVEVAEGGRRHKLSKARSPSASWQIKAPEGIFGHSRRRSTSFEKPAGCARTQTNPQQR